MKRNLLILVIILLIGFITNSCGDEEKISSCECNPKQHNEGESCCIGNGCNCIIILNCVCPAGTFHLVGENCRGSLNCECELNVAGVRSDNGIPITNRLGFADITTVVGRINGGIDALAAVGYSADTLKNNTKEITLVDGNSLAYDLEKGIIYVGINISSPGVVRNACVAYLDEIDGIIESQ